jgi:glycosyltransferase involved in cell wall biosynthesis
MQPSKEVIMELKNKTILILSPQSWGKMFLSKHHYAVELAKYGNKVYFLNPPHFQKELPAVALKPDDTIKNLTIINHRISFPYNLKFHWVKLFHFLMRFHLKKVLRCIGEPVDIIWSFDLGNLYPFSIFPGNSLKIFHPVDEPLTKEAITAAKGADIIFSVTREILDKYKGYSAPGFFINHGLNEEFINNSRSSWSKPSPLRVGLSGNWVRPDIDTNCLLKIIKENAEVQFEFWGSYRHGDSNIGGSNHQDTVNFIQQLENAPNVVLHGPVPSAQLALELPKMDAFLICYDVQKDQSKGTNYHKVMEYLSTGNTIISNNITTYKNENDLIQMIAERDSNKTLPGLFKTVIREIDKYNAEPIRRIRFNYAQNNLYKKQVERIEGLLLKEKMLNR